MMQEMMALCFATLALLGSPGPAPIALATAGAVQGRTQSLPFFAGIMISVCVALLLTTAGLSILLTKGTYFSALFLFFSLGYILYLAARIVRRNPMAMTGNNRQFSFYDGLLLNIINPKLYAALASIFSAFKLTAFSPMLNVVVSCLIVFGLVVVTNSLWLYSGGFLTGLMKHPATSRKVRLFFATLMVLSVAWVVYSLRAAS